MNEIKNTKIGFIHLNKRIGMGGFAEVYSGRHALDDSIVAVKVLNVKSEEESKVIQSFFQEIQAAAALNHPRIISIYDHGVIGSGDVPNNPAWINRPWLSMELIQGGSLSQKIGHLCWSDIKQVLLDVLEALGHAHARRLIHRDVKPDNVLYDTVSQRIKLTDFGLVHSVASSKDITSTNTIQGTPSYMAPEQIVNRPLSFGPWTDLYAVGCLAWKVVCGQPPFTGEVNAVLRAQVQQELPPFLPIVDVPKGFVDWLRKLLQKDIPHRYQHTAHAAFDLQQLSLRGGVFVPVQKGSLGGELRPVPSPEFLLGEPLEQLTSQLSLLSDAGKTPVDSLSMDMRLNAQTATMVQPALAIRTPLSRPIAGFVPNSSPALAIPIDWRRPREGFPSFRTAGLGLFHLKARPLVGRHEEQDVLWKTLIQVRNQSKQSLVFIDGTPGIGKTALTKWFVHRAEEVGAAQWLYIPLSNALEDVSRFGVGLGERLRILNLSYAEAVKRTRAILKSLGSSQTIDVEALVRLCIGTENERTGFSVTMHLSLEEEEMLWCQTLVALTALRPLILVLDDIHQSPETLSLVERLLNYSTAHPILIIASYSSGTMPADGYATRQLQALSHHETVTNISLAPLKSNEQILLIRGLLDLDLEVAAIIEQRCAGNPQLAVHLVSDWVDRKILLPSESGFVLQQKADLDVPTSLFRMWRRRYNKIARTYSTEDNFALEMAAVLGHQLNPVEWRKALTEAKIQPSSGMLQRLQRHRVLELQSQSRRWSFVHSLLREVILDEARKQGRYERWSAIAANIIEDNPIDVARRAHFLVQSGQPELALQPLYTAVLLMLDGDERGQAKRLIALRDSIVSQSALPPNDKQRLNSAVLKLLLQPLGQRDQTILSNRGTELLSWAERINDQQNRTHLQQSLATAFFRSGKKEEGILLLTACLRSAEQRHDTQNTIRILINLAFMYERQGQLDKALKPARTALFNAEKIGWIEKVGTIYSILSGISKHKKEFAKALFLLEEATQRFVYVDSRRRLTRVISNRGNILSAMGDLLGAEQAYLESIARRKNEGTALEALFIDEINLALVYIRLDRFTEAMKILDGLIELLESPKTKGALPKMAWLYVYIGLAPCYVYACHWRKLGDMLPKLSAVLDEFQLRDEDIEVSLRKSALQCQQTGQTAFAKQFWTLLHQQYQRIGQTEKAQEIEAQIKE